MRLIYHIAGLIVLIALFSSCTGARYNMLHSAPQEETKVNLLNSGVPPIAVGQELCITVTSLNEESAQYFRGSREREGATGIECLYYVVRENGKVDMPLIGDVAIQGMKLEKAEEKIEKELEALIKEPKVRIQFVDYHVSVLGDVAIPGLFSFDEGRVTIFDALAKAGGISQFGRRDNVLVIREEGSDVKHMRIDLTDEEIWNTNYYYLHHNDIVMVSSNSGRITNSKNLTAIGSILVGLGTVAAIIVTR